MAYNFYDKEEELRAAEERKKNAENAVNNVGQFNYARQANYDNALDSLLNRKDFKFDVNNDALYKQMKENYANLGKLAMQDTIGQASAMTGGYGNSYAQTVGQQAYNSYMQQATDAIPELYQMALNRYSLEGDKLAQNLSALSSDRSTSYGEYQDAYNRAANERSYYENEYNNLYNLAYQAARDKVSDEQWAAQYALSKASAARSSSSSSSSNGSGSGGDDSTLKDPTADMFDGALEAYNTSGEAGVNAFVEKYPGYDTDKLFEYVNNHGNYQLPLEDRTYTMVKDTKNWFKGVDGNDIVQDQYGNQFKIKELPKSIRQKVTDELSKK